MNGLPIRFPLASATLFVSLLGCYETREHREQDHTDSMWKTNNRAETTDFKWNDDFIDLVQIENSGLSAEEFEEWAFGHHEWIAEKDRRRLTDQETGEIISQSTILDCRTIERSKKIDSSIQNASKLAWLRLSSDFTESDLEWVFALKQLKGLSLRNVVFDKENFSGLEQLKNLQWLEIALNHDRRNEVQFPPNIQVLIMRGPGVHDHDLPSGDELPNLKYLDLRQSQVTNFGIEQLSQNFPRLVGLDLGFCDVISSDCVASLVKFKELRYLYANHTPLERQSAHAVDSTIPELHRALPDCHIRINER